MRTTVLALVALLFTLNTTAPAHAQGVPDGWRWITDAPATVAARADSVLPGTFAFVSMAPGWHITIGQGVNGALLHGEAFHAAGRFEVSSRLILFEGTANTEYGVFLGGRELGGAGRTWTAFVVRRDGMAAVLRHENGHTRELLPWRAAPSVRPNAGANLVRVSVDSAVHFAVNDSTVAVLPLATTPTAGAYGFRIGRDLNLHVTTLDATLRHAPVPPAATR